jgi:RNA polymerase sigma factor (sigma-70 family)
LFAQTTTHATLIARVAGGGDNAAWDEFCARYADVLRGFALRQGLQTADADDVVQEGFMALRSALPRFEYDPAKGKFRSYLKTVALHAIFKQRRQKRGQVALGEIEELTRAADVDETVERVWDEEWRQYHLKQAMKTIETEFGAPDRQAFQMYALDGQDARKTAEVLNMSMDQVYQAKSRILKRLGQVIEQQVAEEG